MEAEGGGEASMGPRSGERGNSLAFSADMVNGLLQWGRAQVSAEMMNLSYDVFIEADVLQWGRAQVSAEIHHGSDRGARFGVLQWGRAQVSAEINHPREIPALHPMLQWGRAQVSAEMVSSGPETRCVSLSFNGAALR